MGRKAIDMTGQRFGRLVVIRRAESDGWKARWLCRCDCGVLAVRLRQTLVAGEARSCGCLRRATSWRNWHAQRCREAYKPRPERVESDGGRTLAAVWR